MGLRLFISYHDLGTERAAKEREVLLYDTITINGEVFKIVEDDIYELKKALQKLGDDLEIPGEVKLVAYEDLYVYFPIIKHSYLGLPHNIRNTIKALQLMFDSLNKKSSDHVFSLTLAWPTETKEVRISILGHAWDIGIWLGKFLNTLPITDREMPDWLEAAGKWMRSRYPHLKDSPQLHNIVRTSGVLMIQRQALSKEVKCRYYFSEEQKALMYELAIPVGQKGLIETMKQGDLQAAPAFFANKVICSKCKTDYRKCQHSKWIDSGVHQIMNDIDFLFSFWTDRKAG
jgi:hypothetical protein